MSQPTTDQDSLEQVIADLRGDAAVFDRNGEPARAQANRDLAERIESVSEEHITWLSEGDAAMRAGKSEAWVRARFEQLKHDGRARLKGRARQYLACAIPRRANVDTAAARGRQAAREAKERKAS